MRRAFTVVEMLVVLAIVLVLTSLTYAAAMRVRQSAMRAEAATVQAQMRWSLNIFASNYNVRVKLQGFGGPNGTFRMRRTMPIGWPETAYLLSIWPYMSTTDNGYEGPDMDMDAEQLTLFLLTGGETCNYEGLSTSPTQPFSPYGVRKRRIELRKSQVVDERIVDPWKTPYRVISTRDQVLIVSAGPDRVFDTADDVRSD